MVMTPVAETHALASVAVHSELVAPP